MPLETLYVVLSPSGKLSPRPIIIEEDKICIVSTRTNTSIFVWGIVYITYDPSKTSKYNTVLATGNAGLLLDNNSHVVWLDDDSAYFMWPLDNTFKIALVYVVFQAEKPHMLLHTLSVNHNAGK